MADPLSVASEGLALVAFALESSKVLYQTIASVRNSPRTVRELRKELEALNGVLETLQEMAGNTDIDFAMLQIPLLRCGKACKEFEAVINKFTTRSGGSKISFRDWVKLRYMGDDIVGFKSLLAMYKSTFSIALANITM